MDKYVSAETIAAIKEALIPVAEKIGQGAEFAWAVLIKQMYVQAFGYAIAAVAAIVIAIVAYKIARWAYAEFKKKDRWDRDGFGFLIGISSIVSVISGLILAPAFLFGAGARVINPDFYAIKFLVEIVTPQKTESSS